LPFVPPLNDEIGEPVEEFDKALAVVCLNRPISEHERRGRLLAALHRLDVAAKLAPGREAVACCEVAARLGEAHAHDRGDSVRAAFVVVEIEAERLLERETFDVRLQLWPAREAELVRELELYVRELDLLTGRAALAHAFLGLLAQLRRLS
jgi:hypothetical protein